MSWYTTGTVSLTNGSKTVTGVGTKWTNSLIGVCAGQMLILKTANTIEICEIASVQSDTQLTLANQYSGTTQTGVSYEIPTAPKVSIEALALRISEMLNYYQQQMNGWQSILTGSGDITLTAPDGRVVTIKSQKALIEAINNTVKKSGDTMTGNLTINNSDSSAVLLRNKKNEEWMLRIHADGSFSIFNKKDGKWVSKFRNDSNANVWRFENTADVTIAGKSVLKTGDYGIGAQTGTPIQNLDEHLNTGFYGTNTAKIPNLPFSGGGSAASLLVLPSESPYWKCEQLSVVNGRIPRIYYRTDTKNDGKREWYEAITSANSTVDSNGFYKKASPILRLYGTKNIELIAGFTVAGCALVNDLAAGVTAKRIDIGHYEIHGSLGFAREGWYIQLPEDANGNKKFFADYLADENGIITIKTFTKKFDFERCEIVAGEPVDITDGRWIDVRLEMPVVEVIENEDLIPSTLNPVIVSEVPDDI